MGVPKYLSGIKASEIYYFSPREFIGFECLPVLQNKLILQGDELKSELDVIINEFGEYDQIIDFYLDSTISLSEKQGVRENEVISFFREGLSRLLKISHKISESLEVLQKQKLSELSDLIREYQEDVFELDDNNNIVNIYARLIKSKAFAESRSKRKKLRIFPGGSIQGFRATFDKRTSWLKLAYADLKLKLRLGDFSAPISSEISNQLIDIQQRVFTLPVIYQHLFENSPVREFNLFLSREKEINSAQYRPCRLVKR